jgi:hypothetical protein
VDNANFTVCFYAKTVNENFDGIDNKQTLEKTKGAITNGQCRDSGNIGNTVQITKTNKTKQHHTEK